MTQSAGKYAGTTTCKRRGFAPAVLHNPTQHPVRRHFYNCMTGISIGSL